MFELKSVGKTYKKQIVLSKINARFATGVTVITGKSGVGKTTLLRLCASAEKPTDGDILWHGNSILKNPKPFRKHLGYAPQKIDFPPDITAMDFMVYIGALKGLSQAQSKEQGLVLFQRLGLAEDADKLIHMYSGGMRRRLGLAQACLGAPKCLILDEPTAELDHETAKSVYDLVFETAKSAVVLMTTHLPEGLSDFEHQKFELKGAKP